ncbi:hypothetical protein PCCS19_46940 [Paenibacillus sp. CCS19]|nr:hypothetical protein PCCS19_46940 [Paenibacillus cellulosilyticus]
MTIVFIPSHILIRRLIGDKKGKVFAVWQHLFGRYAGWEFIAALGSQLSFPLACFSIHPVNRS